MPRMTWDRPGDCLGEAACEPASGTGRPGCGEAQSSQQSWEAGFGQGELGLRSRWACLERLGATSWECWPAPAPCCPFNLLNLLCPHQVLSDVGCCSRASCSSSIVWAVSPWLGTCAHMYRHAHVHVPSTHSAPAQLLSPELPALSVGLAARLSAC